MNRLISAIALAGLTAACGPANKQPDVIPTLPGDGSAHTAKPHVIADGNDKKTSEPNPWEGRTDLIKTPAPKEPSAVKLPPIKRFKLSNGLKVIAVVRHDLPQVAFQLGIHAGGDQVPLDKAGLAQFTAAMLVRGTQSRSALTIAKQIDYVGGTLGGSAGAEATVVSCAVLSKDLNTCLRLLPDIIVHPKFAKSEMDTVRRQLHTTVRQRKDSAGQLATAHFQNLLWGDKNPRGRPMSAQSIERIDRADLVKWHKTEYQPRNAVMVVAGDINPGKLRGRLNWAFRTWRNRGAKPKHHTYKRTALTGIKIRLVDKPKQTQSHIRIGHYGVSNKAPDFYATQIFNYSLGGGGFSSRLMKVVRSEAGKAYGASSRFDRRVDAGSFMVTTFTRSAETVSTIRLILDQLAKMQHSGPTAAEIRDAKTGIAGAYSTHFESTSAVAGAILSAELHGFKEDYVRDFALRIAGVKPKAVRKAARARLDPKHLVIVIVGDAKVVGPQLKAAGWKAELRSYLAPVSKADATSTTMTKAAPKNVKAAKKILARALAAKGGRARLAGVKTMIIRGDATLKAQGRTIPAKIDRWYDSSGKLRLDMSLMGGLFETSTVLVGSKGWMMRKRGKKAQVQELPAPALSLVRHQLWRDQEFILLRYLDKKTLVAKRHDVKIDGVPHYAIRLAEAGSKVAVDVFIDKKTFLIRRMRYAEQGVPTEENYKQYKRVKGIMVAHWRQTKNVQGELLAKVKTIKFNVKLPANTFAEPKASKPK